MGVLTRFTAALLLSPSDENRVIKLAFSGASGLNLGGIVNGSRGYECYLTLSTNFWLSRLAKGRGIFKYATSVIGLRVSQIHLSLPTALNTHTYTINMSAPATNAAAAQTTSKFQSFLNHPAGPKYVDPFYHKSPRLTT